MNICSKTACGNVEIKHHSTSSLIEIKTTNNEEVEQGRFEDVESSIFIDYSTFENLSSCIKNAERV